MLFRSSYLGPFDPLPLSNVTFQSATPGYSGPNPLKWNSPTPKSIAPGATDIYTAAVHVDGPCGAIFYNRAIIEAPAPVQQSNVVSTTVVCPNGWKLAVPIWVHGGGVFTYAIELENTSDTPRRMGWSDSQLRVISNSAKAPGDADGVIVGSDTAAQYTFEIGKPPAATAIVITGPCKPPYMCDFLDGQVSQKPNDAYRASGTADGTSWAGVVPSNTRVIWPIKIYVGYTPPCGKEIKNTTVITHVSTTGEISSTFATAQARVMCPDLGDAPDSSNHAGTPMRMGPYGAPSPLAHYPSVFGASAVGDEGPIHYLAGASSNITSGLPANAIDSALGFRQANNVSQSIVSNERDADWQPDQDLAWLKPNLLTSAVITNARSNRDGYDNAFNHPVTGLPLPQSLNTCSTGLVRYAQYVNPATSYVGNRFVNMWIDWNMDGDWADSFTSSCGAVKPLIINSEWVAQNVVANLATGIYQIPAFVVGNIPVPKRLWVRISIADSPAPISSTGNGPAAGYVYGETEDHLLCYKQPTPAIAASWVDCPAPKIIIDHALPDATVQLNRYFTHTVMISPTDSDPGLPVTVTWSVVSPLKATYDLKANKKVVLAGAQNARYPDQVFNTDPITEVVTTGESSVLVAFFGEGDYTISANVQTADGETETESVTLTAANTRTYLPLVLK